MRIGDKRVYSVMKDMIARFVDTRRGAVAVIFALSLVPMVLLVALSIDYAFYVQARAQTLAAADAAAMNAVRAADNIYTYETYPANAAKYANPTDDAETQGEKIGQLWFDAALGLVPTSTVPQNPPVTIQPNTGGSAGFTATVNFTGTYPPFFDTLFGHTSSTKWNLNGTASAASNYNYVEILLLLDNSSSMLIGASGDTLNTPTLSNIQAVENISVCPPSAIAGNTGGNSWGAYDQNVPTTGGSSVNQSGFENYVQPTTLNGEGYCESGYGSSSVGTTSVTTTTGTGRNQTKTTATYNDPFSPCAFACHTTTATSNGYYADMYGLVENDPNGIQLRLNVLQKAASQVITSLENSEQANQQFTVGVYQFNNNVSAVYPNDGTHEAYYDLNTAASDIASAPAPVQANASIGNTDFAQSVTQLVCGNYTNGVALTAGGTGSNAATPQKDIFIVTDGMEDNSDSGSRSDGEMTSYNVESAAAQNLVTPCGKLTTTTVTPALCEQLKALKFSVYVLYIDYSSLPNAFFHNFASYSENVGETAYTAADYPTEVHGTATPPADLAEPSGDAPDPSFGANPPAGTVTTTVPSPSPDEAGLEGCATAPGDFIEASSDTDIATDLQVLLHSALTSTIQISQ